MLVYIDGLPPEARTWGYDGWTSDRELAAETLELLDVARLDLVYALTGDKKVRRRKPLEVPRPESVRPKKKSWVEFARNLARKVKNG